MALSAGTRLGAYEIVGAIGAGGMGEVYRGRDTKLDRDVAIKVLPDTFASDPERIARFQREAKTLASLNHPHIGTIYGLVARPHGGYMTFMDQRSAPHVRSSSSNCRHRRPGERDPAHADALHALDRSPEAAALTLAPLVADWSHSGSETVQQQKERKN
jgi:serine/threonine protein kinase